MKELELLVRILANGGRVANGGYDWAMGSDGSLCFVDSEEVGHGVDCDLVGLKRMAEEIGRDELWLQCCVMQLAKTDPE